MQKITCKTNEKYAKVHIGICALQEVLDTWQD